MMRIKITWINITLFAIAMGLLETIVVVYLRELYYPEGFSFPLKLMKPMVISFELLRELATIFMLLTLGILTGKNGITRFAWFVYSFAVWDIFYYIFLKLLLDWPASLLTWDVLFLIPVTWTGPVLAPVINSLTMIFLAVILIVKSGSAHIRLSVFEWILLVIGSLIVITSYTKGYVGFMMMKFPVNELFIPKDSRAMIEYAKSFIPEHFDWALFTSGVAFHWLAIGSILLRSTKKS
jgi:hypothetical protein